MSNTARVVTAEDAVYESNTCEFTAQGLFAEVSLDDYREAQGRGLPAGRATSSDIRPQTDLTNHSLMVTIGLASLT